MFTIRNNTRELKYASFMSHRRKSEVNMPGQLSLPDFQTNTIAFTNEKILTNRNVIV